MYELAINLQPISPLSSPIRLGIKYTKIEDTHGFIILDLAWLNCDDAGSRRGKNPC